MKRLKNILLFIFLGIGLLAANAESPDPTAVLANDLKIVTVLNDAEVYPNPADEFIFLKIKDEMISSKIKIEVMSIIGTKMRITHEKLESGLYKINLKNIPTGHYYVMLTIDSEKSLKKFLKK